MGNPALAPTRPFGSPLLRRKALTVGNLAIAILLVVISGVFTAMQAPTNALLGRAVGSSVNAALVSFVVGSIVLGLAAAAVRSRPDMEAVRAVPWYAWTGGLSGALLVTVAAFAVPRLGVGTLLTLLVASQLATSILLDRVGGVRP